MESRITVFMRERVTSVFMDETLDVVEHVLNSNRLSCVPVIAPDNGDCFGIISAPDLVRFHAEKKNPKAVRAWEICTYRPISVTSDVTLKEAARLMLEHKIHHLVIVEGKVLKGFVSSLDLLEHLLLRADSRPA